MSLGPERPDLNPAKIVGTAFAFLNGLGFEQIESAPTIVRYRNGELIVNVYHGRHSYEIGFEMERGEERYSISAIISATDREAGRSYRNMVATSPESTASGVQQLAQLVRLHGERALRSDPAFYAILRRQQKLWAQDLEMVVLANRLRPRAEYAFREGRYGEATTLYEQIRSRLTETEQRKLEIARNRSDDQAKNQ